MHLDWEISSEGVEVLQIRGKLHPEKRYLYQQIVRTFEDG